MCSRLPANRGRSARRPITEASVTGYSAFTSMAPGRVRLDAAPHTTRRLAR